MWSACLDEYQHAVGWHYDLVLFGRNAPNENAVTVQKTVEALTGEYRNRLEEISNTIQHDR